MFSFFKTFFFISKDKFEKTVASSAMDISERLINEMGAEVHDDLIQKFSIFRLYIARIERSHQDPAEVLSLTSKMNAEFQTLNESIRRISRRLMPVNFETDSFHVAVQILCKNMERPGVANIHLDRSDPEVFIPQRTYHFLLRMIQELIHNAQRHSSAWHIWVRIIKQANHLVIEVEDDGTPSPDFPNSVETLKGKRNSLRMRALSIGASISYEQNSRGGFVAKIDCPI